MTRVALAALVAILSLSVHCESDHDACDYLDRYCLECGRPPENEQTPFCGRSVGTCNQDSDCHAAQCNPRVCTAAPNEGGCRALVRKPCPCEVPERYALSCLCVDNRCGWSSDAR